MIRIVEYLHRPNSCHLQWHITERCNFRCKHCYQSDDFIKSEMSQSQLFGVLDDYISFTRKTDLNQWRKLSLTGGEPILKKEFFPLLERASQYKNLGLLDVLCVMTNGSTMTQEVARRYVELGVNAMQISVEGTEAVNDEIRGKGNFRRAVRGAEIIIEHRIPLSFSLTVTKKNVDDIEPLARFAAELGVDGMGIGRLVPLGRGGEYKDIMLSPLEVYKMYKEIERVNNGLASSGYNLRVGLHCSDELYRTENPSYQTHGCSTPYDVFTVLPNGNVVPCRRMPLVVGNVLKQSFFEIFYGSNKYWYLRNQENMNDSCRACRYFKMCKGSGRCLASGYFNNPFAPDPGCWHLFDSLPETEFREKDSDKVSLVPFYVNNLRTDLKPLDLKNVRKTTRKVTMESLSGERIEDNTVIYIDFKESELTMESGKKILAFLERVKKRGKDISIGRPLPRCIFGIEYPKIVREYRIPESCSGCSLMFTVKGKDIVFCNGKKGPELKYMDNEESIREFFSLAFAPARPRFRKCFKCAHLRRGLCSFGRCSPEPLKEIKKAKAQEECATDITVMGGACVAGSMIK